VALKRAGRFVGDDMLTRRWTELLQMPNMTVVGSDSRVGSQVLGEVRYRLVDVFLWQLFPDDLQGDFQLTSCLRLRLGFTLLFWHGVPAVVVQRVQNIESFNKPGRVRLHICMTLETLRNWGLTRAGLTSMPIMPWHGPPPRFRGPPWAARIFLIFKFQ